MPNPIPIASAFSRGDRYTPSKMMWWHDSIIDLMIANPSWTKRRIAQELKATPTFIYMITNSDIFLAKYEKRRAEYERMIGTGLSAKITEVADKTLDRILKQISDEGKVIPLNHLESLADKTLSRLGYGPKPPSVVPPLQIQADKAQVVVIPAARADLEAARQLIREKEHELALAATPTHTEGVGGLAPALDLKANPTIEDL